MTTLRRPSWLTGSAAIAIVLTIAAAIPRFYHLDGRSLWLDEFVTARVIRFDRLSQIFEYLRYWVDNTPFIYIVTWMFRGLGGSEIAIRWPYALAGTLCVPALFFLGQSLVRPRVGVLAAALMSLLPFAVWYSQEARSYSPLMLFSILQMAFAFRAVTRSRWSDWLFLVIFSVLNLYTSNIALLVTAAVCVYVALVLAVERKSVARLKMAATAGLLVGLAYLPWLPSLHRFLARKDLGFGLVAGEPPPTWENLRDLLLNLDLTTVMLVFVCAGLMTCAFLWTRGRWRQVALLVIWPLVPLIFYAVNTQTHIVQVWPRYYAFLYPDLVLLAAIGVEGLSLLAGSWRRSLTWITFASMSLLLGSLILPALLASYRYPKPDYRSTTMFLRQHSPNPSQTVVLAMGMRDVVFFPESLGYYFDLSHTPILVEDARALDSAAVSRFANPHSAVWGVTYRALSERDMERVRAEGFDVWPFVGMTVLRHAQPGEPVVEQAKALMSWNSAARD